MDHEGRVLEWNPAAERIFGLERRWAIGRELAGLIVPEGLRERHRQGLARYNREGDSNILGRRSEFVAVRSGGNEFPVELAASRSTSAR